MRRALGADTRFAHARDGEAGFWVSFFIDVDEYWIMLPRERFEPVFGMQWLEMIRNRAPAVSEFKVRPSARH